MLRAVRRGATFDAARDDALATLDDLDRRLAHEIAAGVLRARTQLDAVLAPRVTHGWEGVPDDLRDVLRVGAYQLLHLERVPTHAAVSSAVEVAKSLRGGRGAGFVNAVLRGVARERHASNGEAPAAATPDPPRDPRALARASSHPEWLVRRWVASYGPERTQALLAHNNRRPSLVLQPARWSGDEVRAALDAAGIGYTTRVDGPGFTLEGGRVRDLPGYREGGFVVQDPAQASVVAFADLPRHARIWDACAAPGGKTAALARVGSVLATDRSRDRLGRLVETVRRAAPAAQVGAADATTPPLAAGSMDAVILDVPCSATGTFSRHPDARWRLDLQTIDRLAREQAALLEGAAPVVRPGGYLIYMTCSLEPEENGDQIERFLLRHPGFARTGPDLSIFPPDDDTDGAFASRLMRQA